MSIEAASAREPGQQTGAARPPAEAPLTVRPDWPFFTGFILLGGFYLFMILAMLVADVFFVATDPDTNVLAALTNDEIRYSIKLSLISCCLTALLSLWVAVPVGYLLSRFNFAGKAIVDAVLDIPIVLPPMVVGISLLILFNHNPISKGIDQWFYANFRSAYTPITFAIPSVIIAQFMVSCAFAVRTMRTTFDQLPVRREQVALTLGCNRAQAFFHVVLPEAHRGIITAATVAWARAMGEFGPILIFAGATRMKTEVLSTSIFLEFSIGKLGASVTISLLMVLLSIIVLVIVRTVGLGGTMARQGGA